jgi:rhodanese-related sulfurtransferase
MSCVLVRLQRQEDMNMKASPSAISELQTRLSNPAPFFFWNVLTDEYFTGPMIPGSVRMPLTTIVRDARNAALPLDAEIVVYCSSDTCPQSTLAAEKLVRSGYRNVHIYEGGVKQWREAGLPLEQLDPALA